jgi:hypothetical protein
MPAGADAKTIKRWPGSLRVLAWVALCLVLVAFSLVVVVHTYVALRAKIVFAELERRTVAWEKSGFSRPVLRGVARPGNAAVAHFKAVDKIDPTYDDRIGWSYAAITAGTPPPAELLALAVEKAEGLSDLRAATQHTQAWKPWDVCPDPVTSTPYPKSYRAIVLLMVLASLEPGDECLRIAADGLRTMWDIAPSGGKIGRRFARHAAWMVLPFATACLRRARPEDVAPAAAEFRAILRDAPTLGEANYADYLALAWALKPGLKDEGIFPRTVANILLAKERRELVNAQRIILARADLFRRITPDRYPWIWPEIARQAAGPLAAPNKELETALRDLERYVNEDREAQALMRAMVLGLELLGGASEALAGDPLLRDPWSGGPLLWRRAAGTTPAVVYSVGPNGKDDGLAAASDDVGLTFPAVGQDLGP